MVYVLHADIILTAPYRKNLTYITILSMVTVLAIDKYISLHPHLSIVAHGIFDELAHAITGILALILLRLWFEWPTAVGTLLGAVLIDIDHIPMEMGWMILTPASSRPYTHSLVMVGSLMCLAGLLPNRQRHRVSSIAFGLVTHLIRDMAEGAGVPLYWPLTKADITIPYPLYAGLLSLPLFLLIWRRCVRSLEPHNPEPV